MYPKYRTLRHRHALQPKPGKRALKRKCNTALDSWSRRPHCTPPPLVQETPLRDSSLTTPRGRTPNDAPTPRAATYFGGALALGAHIARYFLDQVPSEEPPSTPLPNALASPLPQEQVPL